MSENFRPREQTTIETEPKRRWEIATLELMGPRADMQDIGAEIETTIDGKPALAISVADGHSERGREVAAAAVSFLLPVRGEAAQMDREWMQARFAEAQHRVSRVPKETILGYTSGASATLVLLQENNLFIGYVGDTEVRIWNAQKGLEPLMTPHRPFDSPTEYQRLKAAGMKFDHTYRLQTEKVSGLQMSRCLGDNEFEPYLLHEPDIVSRQLGPEDRFLILASDGLWDRADGEKSMQALQQTLAEARDQTDVKLRLIDWFGQYPPGDNVLIKIIELKPNT